MQLLERMFNPVVNNFQTSLGLATKRHALLSGNLANVNTPGYQRKDIDFNLVLQEAQGHHIRTRRFKPSAQIRQDGSSIDLEREVYSLAETELRYQLLTDITNRYFTGLKSVIREGR